MVFKRRDRRPILRTVAELLWPRGGWTRAFHYVRHRLRRLPGTPETIARGVWAGVLTSFTPFYGMHFVVAMLIARVIRGNMLAALLGTFFGNPLTYLPIVGVSLKTGHWILGTEFDASNNRSLLGKFASAGRDLWDNLIALFTGVDADWSDLLLFYDEVFYPYTIGGIIPGVISGTVCYYFTVPLVRAYQKRRAAKIKAKWEAVKKKAMEQSEALHVVE